MLLVIKMFATTNDVKIPFFLLTFYELGFEDCIKSSIHPSVRWVECKLSGQEGKSLREGHSRGLKLYSVFRDVKSSALLKMIMQGGEE